MNKVKTKSDKKKELEQLPFKQVFKIFEKKAYKRYKVKIEK